MKKLYLVITLFEIALLGFLFYRLYLNLNVNTDSNQISLSPIDKNTLVFPDTSEFKYYYELKPGETISDKLYWNNTYAHYSINNEGLNERFNYETSTPEKTYRIITIGDSFTYGFRVDTKNNWTEVLEETLNTRLKCPNINKFEVINLGMEGFDVPYLTKRYKDHGLKYSPDLIIWFESGTGLTRNLEMMMPLIQKCEEEFNAGTHIPKEGKIGCWREARDQTISDLSIDKLHKKINEWLDYFLTLRNDTPTIFAMFNSITDEDKNLLKSEVEPYKNVFITDNVSDIVSKGAVLPDGHPSIKGHKIISNDIYTYIEENKGLLMKCNN